MEKNKADGRKIILLLIVSIIFLLSFFWSISMSPKESMSVTFLNVGQGDATLFETPRGGKILIDGGAGKKILSELGSTLSIFENKIDVVVATHDDMDHIGGLVHVLNKYKVDTLIYSLPNSESELSMELLKVAESKNIKIIHAKSPMIMNTDDGVIVKFLFPISDMSGSESNEASIVTQIIFGDIEFLLTGDLGVQGENYLVSIYGDSLNSDVLKFGHHGSDTSTGVKILQTAKPIIGVVSAGKQNNFGHPHISVLDMASKFGLEILRTDLMGRIELVTNGKNIWME